MIYIVTLEIAVRADSEGEAVTKLAHALTDTMSDDEVAGHVTDVVQSKDQSTEVNV